MAKEDKVLAFIYDNINNLNGDWKHELEMLNIWDDVSELYFGVDDTSIPNTILAYIVLAYNNRSTFLESHKNRFDCKVKIITRLRGPGAMSMDLFRDLVYGQHAVSNKMIKWHLNYQKDWRWSSIIAAQEYHSMTETMALIGSTDTKENLDIGKMQEIGINRRLWSEKQKSELEEEFLALNRVLEDEDQPKITEMDTGSFMRHEGFIRSKLYAKIESLGFPAPSDGSDIYRDIASSKKSKLNNGVDETIGYDELFETSAHVVVKTQTATAAILQRKLKIGYSRAEKIIGELEETDIIGPFKGAKARDINCKNENELKEKLKDIL